MSKDINSNINNSFVESFNKEHGRNPSVHITTFGCQMNEHDSEIILGLLKNRGYETSKERDKSDVAIINTCSIRENADKRFFGTLGQLKKVKEKNRNFIVCVCGCMMQQQHIIDQLKSKYPWVDVIVGTHNLHKTPELIDNIVNEKKKQIEILPEAIEMIEDLPSERLFKEKALVNIMYGCNNFCTYCIVPYTRGRERSRSPEAIIAEVRRLVADGVCEVMLLGQNVNSYKGNFEDGTVCTFANLIWKLNDIEGLERIRFMTSHPKDMSDELIEAFKNCDKLCKYIHLPVQAGSSKVLKRMNRRYTKESYLALVEKIRAAVPDITISTDIIVGFPGETEEDFEETMDLVEKVRYDSAFTFLYSIRKDTPAEKFEDQIPEDVKHQRFNKLVERINQISYEKNQKYFGKKELVLVESLSKNNEAAVAGRTDGFKLVNFQGNEEHIGKLVQVEITECKTFSLEGKIVE